MNLIIADLDLIDFKGHCFTYNKALFNEQIKKNASCSIIANKKVNSSIRQTLPCTPLFSNISGYKPKKNLVQSIFSFYRKDYLYARSIYDYHKKTLFFDLSQMRLKFNISSENFILFHTIVPPQITPIIHWLESFSYDCAPSIGILLRFPITGNLKNKRIHPKLVFDTFQLIKQSKFKHKINILSDSQSIIDEIKDFTDLNSTLLPIPHIPKIETNVYDKKIINIGYLGESRIDKGFHLLPLIVKHIIENTNKDKVFFTIQINTNLNSDKRCLQAENSLKRLPVKIIKGSLDEEDYYKVFSKIQILLLPYSKKIYEKQTSGIFSEAMGFGILPIVPDKTWMAKELLNYGLDLSIDFSKKNLLPQFISKVTNNFTKIQKKMFSIYPKWRNMHNANHFLKIIKNLHISSKNA